MQCVFWGQVWVDSKSSLPPAPTVLEAISDLDFLDGDCRAPPGTPGQRRQPGGQSSGQSIRNWGDLLLQVHYRPTGSH